MKDPSVIDQNYFLIQEKDYCYDDSFASDKDWKIWIEQLGGVYYYNLKWNKDTNVDVTRSNYYLKFSRPNGDHVWSSSITMNVKANDDNGCGPETIETHSHIVMKK